ncbi:SUMF1/EgtB/PvdO family nonheme iron enzyme [Stappia sp. F7233]|uniref:SUMF1/EgtB/PvdO family nonheme iron enzyme n=1 Tax=Stappia albiluteola TaxID=2758565 RepID=A0A839AAB0_9HYPH|nr:SUMF1/EgtB/PvdO family nonheme iron enzyme [Stappia albiluteola]MBA5775699.1 SUMF1/EgtB/PvdO family nonheme iron enzyme [Stappia albiluteola]
MRRQRLGILAAAGLTAMAALQGFTPKPQDDGVVRIENVEVRYREPGEFLSATVPVNGPIGEIRSEGEISIMRRQVTRGDYERCVAAAACDPLDKATPADRPAVGLSYNDAVAYARWLSGETGERWRLPTDREWALAAGTRYRDDAWTEVSDPANPSKRWIATYDAESSGQEAVEPDPQPLGAYGENEHGLQDLSGNVWEWTSTCYIRHRLDTGDTTENCGVRIAEGQHRAYMTAFFRDPKAGACSVGIPPANLGIRLVRDEGGWRGWLGL